MLVGIFSDTHDHLERINVALKKFKELGVEVLLHAGDVVSPFAAKAIKQQWPGAIHIVYGNNDGERKGLQRVFAQIADGPVLVECGGRRISLDHYPPENEREPAEGAEVVVFGHTHEKLVETRDGVLYINPGECCGWLTGQATIAVLDTDSLEVRLLEL